MPVIRAALPFLLFLASITVDSPAFADELRDISDMAQRGQQAVALERITGYVNANPANIQGQFMRGVLLVENGKRDEAIRVFTELTQKYPNLPEPYNNLAVIYAEQGQYEKARIALEKALRTHPSYATAHENLGDIYARMASEAYDKALQLDKNSPRPQNKLALITDLYGPGAKAALAASPLPGGATAQVTDPANKPSGNETASSSSTPTKPVAVAQNAPLKTNITKEAPTPPAKQVEAPKLPITKPEPAKPESAKEPMKIEPVGKEANKQENTKNTDKGNDVKNIELAVNQWAKAWSDKNVSTYLSSYADTFKTPGSQPRKEWESNRRARINAPSSIEVNISDLQIRLENGLARASFKQSYRADNIAKRTSKTLVLRNVSGRWLIEQELTGR